MAPLLPDSGGEMELELLEPSALVEAVRIGTVQSRVQVHLAAALRLCFARQACNAYAPEFSHNTLPWLKAIDAEYGPRGLKVVSVYTPEFEQERNPANVRAAVKDLGINYPVMIDGDYSYWRAMKNRYWPAFFLVDRDGKIVLGAFVELHRGEKRGDAMEAAIREHLASSPKRCVI